MIAKALALLGDLPTTQARVATTLCVLIGTALRYFTSKAVIVQAVIVVPRWEPSYEWLAFLVVMSGLDATQFFVKRTTDANYVAAKNGALPDPVIEAERVKA